jgi:tetrapyrrole methylase family protein / MazG family protein
VTARVVVVGLGPGGPDLTTRGAHERLMEMGDDWVLRTHRHPAASPFAGHQSYDRAYESGRTFAEVYRSIADDVVARARHRGQVGYAVPGSPHVLERTVELLRDEPGIEVEIEPGMSFLELAWGRLGVDPVEAGVRLVDGHRFAVDAAGATGPLLVAHCHAGHVLSDIKLAYEDEEPETAVILQRLGLPDESVTEVAWADLDRSAEPDHLTSVFVPSVGVPVARELIRFDELVRTLRQRCPWDREQTHRSLTRYLVEETYELVEAVDAFDPGTGDGYEHLVEELGDLLYQIFFHATIASEAGAFTIAEVARGIHDKLERRHPHVFGDLDPATTDVEADWEVIKQQEKGRTSVMDGIPRNLPALMYAQKVLSRLERLGADGPGPADADGDLAGSLLALVALARQRGLDAEEELRRAADALVGRARAVERPDDGR